MKVRVWNRNKYPFVTRWRDDSYRIEPNQYVEMEYDDANTFVGEIHVPIKLLADGKQDPLSYQMLEIERLGKLEKDTKFPCNACSFEATTRKDLLMHVADKHSDNFEDPEEGTKALIKELAPKKKGRPKKEIADELSKGTGTTG